MIHGTEPDNEWKIVGRVGAVYLTLVHLTVSTVARNMKALHARLIRLFLEISSNLNQIFIKKNEKKCVAYPKEDFLFTILYGDSWRPPKSIYITSKVKKNRDTYGIYPTKFATWTQKHKKIIEPPNQPIEIKKSQIKVCLVLQNWKEGKNSHGSYPT
jgi:hypothetical protein